ncbi:hypothetical protein EUX98_g2743 [Antrodiella citrinella]|uniref:beta-N-acetylhexosaminidase n=1 Tax=Antrodiella citrinella TaxID=2447956 RepID=A0A4S4MZL3_9APHY|nr:hypothetical protein EUX98_g2743 [Antrodiella citrinella]
MATTRLFFFLACTVTIASAIWPIPTGLTEGLKPVKLSGSFNVSLDIENAPTDLVDAVQRTISHLKTDTFERLVIGRGAADADAISDAPTFDALVVSLTPGAAVRPIAQEATVGIDGRDESYSLIIPSDGSDATLVANSTLGLFRGLTTFDMLWYHNEGAKYILNAPLTVTDSPAFPYRGFSFDTARNFFPVSDIKRTLDAMSWVKLSILYWHIADSQSFPLQVPAFPELSQKGAYSDTEFYAESDVKDIIQYANERGIDVVMELDTPGHTTAIGLAYPEYIACMVKSPWATYASEPPAGQLRIASNATVQFVKELFQSTISLLTGTMMSSGGDEVNLPCWSDDEETQEALAQSQTTIAQALDSFIQEVQGVMKSNGKMPFIKSDMVLTHNVTVTNNTAVVVWQTSADAVEVAERGLRFIHQPSDYFYLDCGAGGFIGNDIDGVSWCDPFKTWQYAYSFDPYANLTVDQYPLVLGGQMPIWSEQTAPENLDPIVWPRLAAGAEVFWTGATLPDGSPRLGINATSALADDDICDRGDYEEFDWTGHSGYYPLPYPYAGSSDRQKEIAKKEINKTEITQLSSLLEHSPAVEELYISHVGAWFALTEAAYKDTPEIHLLHLRRLSISDSHVPELNMLFAYLHVPRGASLSLTNIGSDHLALTHTLSRHASRLDNIADLKSLEINHSAGKIMAFGPVRLSTNHQPSTRYDLRTRGPPPDPLRRDPGGQFDWIAVFTALVSLRTLHIHFKPAQSIVQVVTPPSPTTSPCLHTLPLTSSLALNDEWPELEEFASLCNDSEAGQYIRRIQVELGPSIDRDESKKPWLQGNLDRLGRHVSVVERDVVCSLIEVPAELNEGTHPQYWPVWVTGYDHA